MELAVQGTICGQASAGSSLGGDARDGSGSSALKEGNKVMFMKNEQTTL